MNKGLKIGLAFVCAMATLLSGCSNTNQSSSEHEAITIMSPYNDLDAFIEVVHEKYPEVNLKIVPYSGGNTTTYVQDMLEADDLTDICLQTLYDPSKDDVSDKMIDLSGYDFTDNYVESRLKDVSDTSGAIYMLPSAYTCFGITYNKTLLEEHGWTLPQSFSELEELAQKAKAAGVQLCQTQIQYPGYGFQYLCNISDTSFLGTLAGKQWQNDYLSGKANVSDTPEMLKCMFYIQKWKDLGMLDITSSDPSDDAKTKESFSKGNTLFLLGNQNGMADYENSEYEFGLMPYLSEDGSQNVYILNVKRYYGISKKLENNKQKLEDALKVMEVLSTVEGTSALYDEGSLKSNLLPFKDASVQDSYYEDIADSINAGNTVPYIYSGWENTIVNTGNKMLDFIKGEATLDDVVKQLDEDQDSVVNNKPVTYTTTTETITQKNCAKLIGQCFAKATHSDAALISLGTWIKGNGPDQNKDGLSGKLYAKEINESDLCTVLPTWWSGTIQTIELTGKEIKQLAKKGYDCYGNGKCYPYVLVSPSTLENDKTYQIAICGVEDSLSSKVVDSGIVGMDAAKEFFGQFKTLSNADAKWKSKDE